MASCGRHSGCLGVMGICVAREHQCAETTVSCDSEVVHPRSNPPASSMNQGRKLCDSKYPRAACAMCLTLN